MINIRRIAIKSAGLLIIAVSLITSATACIPSLPSGPLPSENPPPPSPISSQAPVPTTDQQPVPGSGDTAINNTENAPQPQSGPAVEIMMIHYRGTLTRIGCCEPMLYEMDEFVVIQNRGDTPQDITGWSLTNITRGYPTFRFPPLFPCLPYTVPAVDEQNASESTYTVIQNPAQSVINSPSSNPDTTKPTKPTNQPASEVNWASCAPLEPLDQTPMKPAKGQQGKPVPSILYPGQTVLVFTDEVHCSSGGFSFNWGLGNIWNNEIPDTAVLYNSEGAEISRRSYTVGRQ